VIRSTAAEMAAKLVAGEVTSVALTQAHLDRIASVDADVHAFLHVDTEGALAQAAAIDAKRAKGEKLSPLAGVPLALKDVMAQK
jgi:aspartyl-tRNA(Asn)/glutamyl-tRNA(Gln) amidotransferase subunit A